MPTGKQVQNSALGGPSPGAPSRYFGDRHSVGQEPDSSTKAAAVLPVGVGLESSVAPRAVTINDVGAAAGVSRQTVTRAMNGMDGISATTRERVLRAARDLGYRPSRFGRGLVKGGHATLGLVIEDLANSYYPELASAVLSSATAAGWNVLLADDRHATNRHGLLSNLALQVDGVVGYLKLAPATQRSIFTGLAVVEIDPPSLPPQGAVMLDFEPAMIEAVQHLVARGVRRPVMIDRSPPGQPSPRAQAFVAAMARAHRTTNLVHVPGDSTDDGLAGAHAMLATVPDADAVMTFNDLVALGVIRALRGAGRAVPDDVRVVGIDGLHIGGVVTPALTTLALDMNEVGREAVDLVVGMTTGMLPQGGTAVQRRIRHRLLVRESS